MYDTLGLRLYVERGARVLDTLTPILTDVSEHIFNGGDLWISGNLGNLKITANSYQVRVKEGSLCKWYLGDNLQVLGKSDTGRAIEALSDVLHLPMAEADVLRLDVAANVILKHPVSCYLEHLGQCRYYKRLQEPDGIYYTQGAQRLCLYDKIAEVRKQGEDVPELYQGRNVLRYESRYLKRVPARLGRLELKASTLYADDFHREIVRRWHNQYTAICKENEILVNLGMVNSKRDFYRLGTLALVEMAGGESELLEQIAAAQKKGLTPKQAYDLRRAVRDACRADGSVTMQAGECRELDTKIADVAKICGG